MKKFKLIKEYPQSPNLNTIVTWREESMGYVYIHPTKQVLWGINGINPEDYPEFWKDINQDILFITEDGIKILDGDYYYIIDKETLKIRSPKPFKACHELIVYYNKSSEIRFASLRKAQNFVKLNRKRFSISDLEKLHHHGWKHLHQMKVDLLNSFK